MFATSTSTIGSILEILRSPPSVASHSQQKNSDNIGMNSASGALCRPAKSSASIASFNSSTRYPHSSYSNYSASAPVFAGSVPEIFKRQYVQQAIRLVDDALTEQEKGSSCDESYALDCYLASLEYFLSAVSTEASLHRQIGSVDRQAIVHAKLCNLLRRTEDFSASSHEEDSASRPTEKTNGWWNGVWGRTDPSKTGGGVSEAYATAPSELAAQCGCGRKVLVKIPECFLSDRIPDRQPEIKKTERRNFLWVWYGWALSLIYTIISIFNGVVLPSVLSFLIRTSFAFIVYIEKRFEVVNFILNIVISTIKLLLKISRDYNLNKQIGDFFSWLISKLVKVALAFIKTDEIKHLDKLFDLDISDHKDNNRQDSEKPLADGRSHNHRIPQGLQSNHRFSGDSSSSSSRFSVKSDSTYQLNSKDRELSNAFIDNFPNASLCRTSKYG